MNRVSKKNPYSGLPFESKRRYLLKNQSKFTQTSIKAHPSDVYDAAKYQREASSQLSHEKIKNLRSENVLSNSKELVKETRNGSYQFS
jgi:hypothetical protein